MSKVENRTENVTAIGCATKHIIRGLKPLLEAGPELRTPRHGTNEKLDHSWLKRRRHMRHGHGEDGGPKHIGRQSCNSRLHPQPRKEITLARSLAVGGRSNPSLAHCPRLRCRRRHSSSVPVYVSCVPAPRHWGSCRVSPIPFLFITAYVAPLPSEVRTLFLVLARRALESVVDRTSTATISGDFSHGPQHVFWTCSNQMDKSRDMSLKKILVFWMG